MLSYCRYPQPTPIALALFSIALLLPALTCHAQDTPTAVANDVRDLRAMLEGVSYNPAEQGPLLVVAPGQFTAKRQLPPKERPVPSLRVVAAAASREVIRTGAVTTLAPDRMMVITANPGKAKPLAGTNMFRPFLASLTPEQWQLVGSARGIGIGDLSSDQQLMYDTVLPDAARVETLRYKVAPDDPTGKPYFMQDGETVRYERSAVRLRLRFNTQYRFYTADGKSNHGSEFIGSKIGDTERILVGEDYDQENSLDAAERQEQLYSTAYGVLLRQRVPSRLKPSQLDYAAPALNVLIPLTPDLKTIRDVLTVIGQYTHLELRADLRVADLPVYLRTAPNQGARAGDLLMALAWGITGAYRRMEDGVFLLTDDIEGIGTRFARLSPWVVEADQKRQEILKRADVTAGLQDPLRYLKYDAEARGALPEDLRKKIVDEWTKPKSDSYASFRTADLPASVRNDVERYLRSYLEREDPIHLDASRVRISLSLRVVFVLPDGSEANATGNFNTGTNDLLFRMMTAEKQDTTTQPAETPPPSTPKALTRGAVLAMPATAKEAKKLITAVKRCGLTEVWVQVPLKGANRPDTAPLTAAIAAGKQAEIGVYAVVSLLKGDGVGTSERNILGQDGDALAEETIAFYSRLYANRSDSAEALTALKQLAAKYRGWLMPDAELRAVREKQLRTLAAIPGLSGITLRDTEGPGYTWDSASVVNGRMGYTATQRLAFLREKGYDPIDVFEMDTLFPISPDLPFFSARDLQTHTEIAKGGIALVWSPWFQFREARNRELLGALYASLKKANPTLPLYIDDRASSYTPLNPSWYGSWDAADRFPRDVGGDDFAARMMSRFGIAAARRASKTVLLLHTYNVPSGKPDEQAEFAQTVTQRAGIAAQEWDGLVLDMSELPMNDVLRLLEGVRLLGSVMPRLEESPKTRRLLPGNAASRLPSY